MKIYTTLQTSTLATYPSVDQLLQQVAPRFHGSSSGAAHNLPGSWVILDGCPSRPGFGLISCFCLMTHARQCLEAFATEQGVELCKPYPNIAAKAAQEFPSYWNSSPTACHRN